MYTPEQRTEIIDKICLLIEEGKSLRDAAKGIIDRQTFYNWLNEDASKIDQYARACERRADAIFEEILDISDDQEGDVYIDKDGNEVTNHNVIQRARLRVDSRKWMLGKMNPKKYGESSLLKLGDNEGKKLEVSTYTDEELIAKANDILKQKK